MYTPHAGLTLAGVSGPYAPFRSAAALATVDPGANSGDKPLVHAGEELVFILEGTMTFDIAGTAIRGRARRCPPLHGRPGPSLGQRGQAPRLHLLWVALRDS